MASPGASEELGWVNWGKGGSNGSCSYLGTDDAKKTDLNTSQSARVQSEGQGPQVQTGH